MDYPDTDMFGPLTRRKWKAPIPLKRPDPGCLLVERVVNTYIRITRPDGSYVSMVWTPGPNLDRMIRNEKIPPDKVDQVLRHVWEYRQAYVSCEIDQTD